MTMKDPNDIDPNDHHLIDMLRGSSFANVMAGGIDDTREILADDSPYAHFEQDVNEVLGDQVRESVEASKALWSALTNTVWCHGEKEYCVLYTFRSAGDLVAAIRGGGTYHYWYCASWPGVVSGEICRAMESKGWVSHSGLVF